MGGQVLLPDPDHDAGHDPTADPAADFSDPRSPVTLAALPVRHVRFDGPHHATAGRLRQLRADTGYEAGREVADG